MFVNIPVITLTVILAAIVKNVGGLAAFRKLGGGAEKREPGLSDVKIYTIFVLISVCFELF